MEPWNHGAQGKTVSPHGMIARCKDTLVDSHSRTCTFGENMFVSGRESVCSESFCEVNFPGMTGKQLCINSVGDVLGGRRTENRMMSISSAFEFVESNSRMSRSIVEEDAKREALLIDLKLGGFPDHRDVYRPNFSRGIPMAFSPDLSTPPKRARAGGESLQTIYCQVHGCNKDLSSSKDYHKRHKVCEVHSKTSKVIVNGIEQRFCQQCSRFHLLSEFDDGKRSCRKRLAGHNERRRKPQVGIRSGRTGRILQSYNGGRFQGSALPAESFICRDLLPGRLLHSDKYGLNDLCRQVKVEEETNYCSLSAIRNINGVLDSNSIFSYGYDKQFSNFNVNGTKTAAASIFGDGTSQYQSDLQSSKVSGSLFQETSIGNNEYNIFDTASTIRGLPGIPDSQCALSLLSSQSRNSSSHSAGHPVGRSVILGNMHSGSKASSIGLPRKLPSSALSPKGKTDLDPLLISDGHEVNFQIANEIGQGSKFTSSKQSLSCEDSPTIKLLQLSSQLQRVEHQKQFMQAKQDSDTFCYKRIT